MPLRDLEKRIKALEDLEEIKKIHREYMSCLDNLQFERALDFFTEDAEVEVRNSGVLKGRKNYSKIYLGTLAQRKERYDGHLVGQPVIAVDGNTAKGHWIVYMFFSVPAIEWIQGRHDCEYVKENGKWKFSKLKFARTLASKPSLYP
ncbi:MAG: nuclear transport factor 2 family protein [Thermodesulfobacteriota bacterium]